MAVSARLVTIPPTGNYTVEVPGGGRLKLWSMSCAIASLAYPIKFEDETMAWSLSCTGYILGKPPL